MALPFLRAFFGMLCLLAALPAAAQVAGPSVVLVLDSSGSMAAEMEGAPRLDAARAAVRGMADTWPEGQALGLVAYGHRRTGDCADIETLIPPGPLDRGALDTALDGLRARGKTPLSDALRVAAGLLPDGGGTVVLVSDGLETCDADPCAVAAELRAAKARLVIHVIGFGVTEAEVAALSCIAANGGGRTESADSAAGLAQALAGMGEEAAAAEPVVVEPEPEPEPEEAPAPPPPPTPVPVTFAAVMGGAPMPAPVGWRVVDAAGQLVHEGAGRELALVLLPGDYTVTLTGANLAEESAVTVPDMPGMTPIPVPLAAGYLTLSVLPGEGLPPLTQGEDMAIEVIDAGGAVVAGAMATAAPGFVLAPGGYVARLGISGATVEMPVTVKAGGESAAAFVLPATEVALTLALAEGGPALTDWRDATWTVIPGPGLAALGLGPALQGQPEAAPRLQLVPGDWEVTVVSGVVTGVFPLTVTPGGPQEARFALGAARLTMEVDPATAPPPLNAVFSVLPAGGGEAVYSGGTATALSVVLPAGDWRVEVLDEQGRKAAADVTLAPGDEATVRLVLAP